MQTFEKAMKEILAITDPREAYIALATNMDIPLDEGEKILEAYIEKYGVDEYEMAFYPNGERVLKPEMFW